MKFSLCASITSLFFILTFSYSQEEWRQFTTQDGMIDDLVRSIHQSKAGDIWIGTAKGFDRFYGGFENYVLGNTHLYFFESSSGQLVANTKSLGNLGEVSAVYLFDGVEWDEPDYFNDNDILLSTRPEFAVESNGKLWISTEDGLVGFDGQKWQLYDADVGTDWLVKTPDGRFWTESWDLDGIASFDGQKWKLEFNTDNSLLDSPITNTVLITATGQILLGTDEGLFQYDPDLIR